jgi:hypothetical protein
MRFNDVIALPAKIEIRAPIAVIEALAKG